MVGLRHSAEYVQDCEPSERARRLTGRQQAVRPFKSVHDAACRMSLRLLFDQHDCTSRLLYTSHATIIYGRPMEEGRPLYFCPVISIFFFPRLISAVGDWMSTILAHMVWP